jgi:hypothetical protein
MASLRTWALVALVVAGCNQAPTLSHFDSDGVAFDYPSTWNAATFDMPSSFNHWWVWLSTETMADPCDRVSNSEMTSINCERSPVVGKLRPNGLLLDWVSNGWLGWSFNANAGEPITVDGVGGTLEVLAADSDCLALNGATQIRVIVPHEVPHNWTDLDGCINGQFEGAVRDQIMAMLASADLR